MPPLHFYFEHIPCTNPRQGAPCPLSRWYEPIDRRAGRPPAIRRTETTITFEWAVLGGILRDELFVPTPRTRLVIRCDQSGDIVMRILEGRSSGV